MRPIMLLVPLLLLAGCAQTELHGGLSETQANDMVAVLRNAGIDARKVAGGEAGWQVTAPDKAFARAVSVIRESGYPRREQATLGDLFKKEGFISSQVEERARLKFGLQQELERALSGLDGVVAAHVMLDVPDPGPLDSHDRHATASVVLYEASGGNLARHRANVRALVADSVSGLAPDRVGIQILPHQPLPTAAAPAGPAVSIASVGTILLLLAGAAAGAAALPSTGARLRRRLRIPAGSAADPGTAQADRTA